jgi:AcrR family transcriptional regulator
VPPPDDLATLLGRALHAPREDHSMDERILDGALREVAERGTRAATMDGIARRGHVGRMTLFRRFKSKDELLQRLAVRELRRFLDEVDASLQGLDDPRDRVVEAFALCVRFGARHPLVVRLAPGAILDQLVRGEPSPLDMGRAFVAARLDHPDADAVADVLVRLALTYVLLPSFPDEEAARAFARERLAPLVA